MKKIMVMFFMITAMAFSLEITHVDTLDFGTVVKGDRNITAKNVEVDVKGRAGREVEIVVPERYDLEGNTMEIKPRDRVIRLDGNGRGIFRIDAKLNLRNSVEYKALVDKLSIKVRYIQ